MDPVEEQEQVQHSIHYLLDLTEPLADRLTCIGQLLVRSWADLFSREVSAEKVEALDSERDLLLVAVEMVGTILALVDLAPFKAYRIPELDQMD